MAGDWKRAGGFQPGGRHGGRHQPGRSLPARHHSTSDSDSDEGVNTTLVERLRSSRGPHRPEGVRTTYRVPKVVANPDIQQYVKTQAQIGDKYDHNWLKLHELPSSEEVCVPADQAVSLATNKLDKPWKSQERYLRSHHEILREDAISPLREAITAFRADPGMTDTKSTSVYEKVHIVGFTFAKIGIAARIQFSTARAGCRILWDSSKRLVSGSIVALTSASDNFQTKCLVAVVACRALRNDQEDIPEIDIVFNEPDDIHVDPQEEWVMVEARQGYYEAHRHTLSALQKMSQETFPLAEHICFLSKDIKPPIYIEENPILDLSAVVENCEGGRYNSVDVLNEWPRAAPETLDDSQWEALHQIITNRFAMVQGPPGCGKTFVSKLALQILTRHVGEREPPIIVAAQTNHALDQLLEHISTFEPEYIRLGGRSTNINVKQRALFEVSRNQKRPRIEGGLMGGAVHEWKSLSRSLREVLAPLSHGGGAPTSGDTLYKYGVITDQQYEALKAGALRWVSSAGTENEPLKLWVGQCLVSFDVKYKAPDFEVVDDEEDLEFEQLREAEAEQGVTDDEDVELLKGDWCGVYDKYTCFSPSQADLEKVSKILDAGQDLWKVPERLRGPTYLILQRRLKDKILVQFREKARRYQKVVQNLKIGKWERDAVCLQNARIIGMTTTGLSKYRALISSLKPKIVLIEEAAEVVEAPVSVACMESVQHLILVGDHKQLRGHCTVRELEQHPYNLNVSLFERMVTKAKVPYAMLLRQRRMRPQFRRLISSLYPGLQDHPSVMERHELPQWGTGEVNCFFFDHTWSEYRDSQMSTYNAEEAKFIAGFYRHLFLNEVPTGSITVLTFYNGQRKRILKEIRDFPEMKHTYHHVKTVDSYQGEENDIIILSLVRSNNKGQIGFLDNSNRVCVALSRAKMGLYLFGNSKQLTGLNESHKHNPLWRDVVALMSSQPGQIGKKFPIKCVKHGSSLEIEYPDDWGQLDGGCKKPCGMSNSCGHPCPLKCHIFPHEGFVDCEEKCTKNTRCGHPCRLNCHDSSKCECSRGCKTSRYAYDQLASEEDDDDGSDLLCQDQIEEAVGQELWTGPPSDFRSRRGHAPGQGFSTGNLPHVTGQSALKKPFPSTRSQTSLGARSSTGASQSDDPFLDSHRRGRAGSTHTRRVSGPGPAFTQQVAKHEALSAKQRNKLHDWSQFATGGVKLNDEIRAQSPTDRADNESARAEDPSSLLIDLSPEREVGPIKGEKSQAVAGGRTKFTQDFQPAGSRPGGFGLSPSPEKRKSAGKSAVKESVVKSLLD